MLFKTLMMSETKYRFLALFLAFAVSFTFFSCSKDDDDDKQDSKSLTFEQEMDEAMRYAKQYGPVTQALAEEVASRNNGVVTPLNYKTRESATRKCNTDNCRPFDLKDLARTSIVCKKADVDEAVKDLNYTATERGIFYRYKHQTSDYGYWGDLTNLKFEKICTEIQVKSYGMFYASYPESLCRELMGDSVFDAIHTATGLEPNLSHHYYEILRADTTSESTKAYYKQLALEYHQKFDEF